ncbi:MAG: BatA domain-containing protein [Planctomycetaceae bacterium]|nr:BatA domain-containing protein [Planctomycetaceae bacterium]
MEFLTPLFAAIGAAAAAVPVVLHMLRRAPTQDMPFSLVRFLKPSQPKLTKRSSIEHWPLMLLRMLALVLIGLAFARPFLRHVVSLAGDERAMRSLTILVDSSASMRRDGLYEQVQEAVKQVVADLRPDDLLSVATFSAATRTVISRDDWLAASDGERTALVDAFLADWEPDWNATNTGQAMRIAADELAAENADRPNITQRRLIVITDFQRGSDLNELKTGQWPDSIEVDLKVVEPLEKGNAGLTFLPDRRLDRMRVRLMSAGDTVRQDYRLQMQNKDGQNVGEPVAVTVPPGQRRSVVLPAADRDSGEVVAMVGLLGDDHMFDNWVDLPAASSPIVTVAHIGSATRNDPESMRYYLQRVLSGNDERDVRLVDLIKQDGVVLPVPADAALVVATDAIPPSLMKSVEEFLSRSGTLLLAPPDVAAVKSLGDLLPPEFTVEEADIEDYAMLGTLDYEHPLLSVFAESRFADFSSIRFWHHRRLEFSQENRTQGDWSVIARFDTGLPAIAEIRAEDTGRIFLLAAGWQPADSQLALSTRFPPLLTRVLSLAAPVQRDQLVATVGDKIRPGTLVSAARWTLTGPDERTLTTDELRDEQNPDDEPVVQLQTPGRYLLEGVAEDGSEQSLVLIAGIAASESQTETLPIGQLQALRIGVESNLPGSEATDSEDETATGQLSANELEDRQKWWRRMLLAGLACLALEAVWARRLEQKAAA